jgi:hypothetical protein
MASFGFIWLHLASFGFIWSNLVDRAWLFCEMPLHKNQSLKNDLWHFEMDEGGVGSGWTELDAGENVTNSRPTHGASCNVPDLQKGYYWGGITRTGGNTVTESSVTYLHFLTVFNMQQETMSTIPVPDFVPVVNQSLVILNTATRSGALVALGGYVERNGTLPLVR